MIIGFNVRALNPSLHEMTFANNIQIIHHSIIYALVDDVVARLEAMLAPRHELVVTGEAEVVEIFRIKIGRSKKKPIGGCKVLDGTITMRDKCRITRQGKIIYTGLSSFATFINLQVIWIP